MVQSKKIGITKQLKRELADLNNRWTCLEVSIVKRIEEIDKLTRSKAAEESERRTLEFQIAETTNRIFARACLPPQFIKARSVLIRKMLLAQSDNITVARQKALRQEVVDDLSALQGTCCHQFVFSYDGYGGSQSDDYDDQYYGHRVCALCNWKEDSTSTRKNIYTVLAEDGTRLVRRDLRDRKKLPKPLEKEWFSIGLIHQLFEASAGYGYIIWPEAIEKGTVLKL